MKSVPNEDERRFDADLRLAAQLQEMAEALCDLLEQRCRTLAAAVAASRDESEAES